MRHSPLALLADMLLIASMLRTHRSGLRRQIRGPHRSQLPRSHSRDAAPVAAAGVGEQRALLRASSEQLLIALLYQAVSQSLSVCDSFPVVVRTKPMSQLVTAAMRVSVAEMFM